MLWTVDHAARAPLQEQIAGCVRGGLRRGELVEGDRLPPAQELAEALGVDRNTVLAAYRALREAGVLEFRRGRGVRVAAGAGGPAARGPVDDAARELVELAREHGVGHADLVRLIEELR